MAPRFIPLKTRFDQKWRLDPDSECWIWEGTLHVNGYGKFFLDGKLVVAHRVAWQLYKGEIPEGLVLDHLCRRKNCVNPKHLDPITPGENSKRRNYEVWRELGDMPTLRSPRKPKPTLRERFDAKWKLNPENGCWEWTAALNVHGYGFMSVDAWPTPAHRVSYELNVGKIPDGLHIDHLCRNRRCVNPTHLEPVTNKENGRRGKSAEAAKARAAAKTHCKRGHPLSGDNLRRTAKQRICRACFNINRRAWREKNEPKKGRDLSGLALGAQASSKARLQRMRCKNGHLYDGYKVNERTGYGQRTCKACNREKMRLRNMIKRQKG